MGVSLTVRVTADNSPESIVLGQNLRQRSRWWNTACERRTPVSQVAEKLASRRGAHVAIRAFLERFKAPLTLAALPLNTTSLQR